MTGIFVQEGSLLALREIRGVWSEGSAFNVKRRARVLGTSDLVAFWTNVGSLPSPCDCTRSAIPNSYICMGSLRKSPLQDNDRCPDKDRSQWRFVSLGR